ncbi:CD27 antigen isoform X1 [Pangasianodon hypophthalmus]|uniref:CD27 antigen isoform X1 n=1 Tax=Pangasianodon hypophthalmus TaxID=310915 RepID=UPI000EFDDCF4|nr:CD27 antigen isoform X1 [Pangasianodon hypophthalmus]
MLISWCCFLLLSHFLCHVHPKECNNTYEYEGENIHCCKKCGPGERMDKRCTKDFDTKCKQCTPDFFMDEFSTEMECKRCSQCTKEHMVYKVNCSHSTDAVCGCENGYECPSNSCTDCVKIPTTTPRPTPTPSTTTITVISKNVKKNEQQTIPSEDTQLHVDGPCWLQLVFLGDPRKLLGYPVSAQKMRKCRCRSRRCVDIKTGKKKPEGDRGKWQERGRKRHLRVWIDYKL